VSCQVVHCVNGVVATDIDQGTEVILTRNVAGHMMAQRSATFISHRSEIDAASHQAIEHGDTLHQIHQVEIRQTIDRRTGVKQ
jgi:hypothetical protein